MTKEQALDLLSQVAAAFHGTLQEHNALQEALKVLRGDETPTEESGK